MPFLWIGLLTVGGAAVLFGALTVRRKRIRYPAPQSYIVEPPTEAAAVRVENGDVELRWHREAQPSQVTVQPAAPDYQVQMIDGHTARISSLDPAVRYTFEIQFADGQRIRTAERFLPLQGAVNFRDLGGYTTADGRRVRWNCVFRSGTLAGLTQNDYAYLQQIGIQIVCDVRNAEEVAVEPDALPDSMRYFHIPIYTDSDSSRRLRALMLNPPQLELLMQEAYTRQMIDRNARPIGDLLRRLANPENLPVLIHCTAGKDRTGITMAVLLSVLGVPDDVITADYSLSNYYYEAFRQIVGRAIDRLKWFGITVSDMQLLLTANPRMMQAVLDHIRQQYGSVEGYLRDAAGIEESVIQRLRENLLE